MKNFNGVSRIRTGDYKGSNQRYRLTASFEDDERLKPEKNNEEGGVSWKSKKQFSE